APRKRDAVGVPATKTGPPYRDSSALLGCATDGGFSVKSRYGQKQARLLQEQLRRRAYGLRGRPATFTPLTLAQTVAWSRRVPRSARIAQGFAHIDDFARHVKQVRSKRAELHRCHPHPLRHSILETLKRIFSDRDDLMKAARREARAHWRPHVEVWWRRGKPQVFDNVRD